MRHLLFAMGLSLILSVVHSQENTYPSYKLVYEQDFESATAINGFEKTDPQAWRLGTGASGQTLQLFKESQYKTRVRSPFNIAIIKNIVVGDFIMELDLNQTGKEYGHRDLCLFFGYQNPSNFYYVHLGSRADAHANNIFLVNDEPRVAIASKTSEGVNWGSTDSWHKVRLVRTLKTGEIKVYFDNMEQPIMEATDLHFTEGYLGVGSFDDVGQFDNIKIWAPTVKDSIPLFFDEVNYEVHGDLFKK